MRPRHVIAAMTALTVLLILLSGVPSDAGEGQGKGKGPKPGTGGDTPVTVAFRDDGAADAADDITSDGDPYADGAGVKAALLAGPGHLLLDTRGAEPERTLNLSFEMDPVFTVPVYMIVALVDPESQTDIDGSLAGMTHGDTGSVRVVINFGDPDDDNAQYRFRMGPNPLSELGIDGTHYLSVSCTSTDGMGKPCTDWIIETDPDSTDPQIGRLFRFWSSKGKGRLDQMEEIGDGNGFDMSYGLTVSVGTP